MATECQGNDPLRCSASSTPATTCRRQKRRTSDFRHRQLSNAQHISESETTGLYNVDSRTCGNVNVYRFRHDKPNDRRKFGDIIKNVIKPLVPQDHENKDAYAKSFTYSPISESSSTVQNSLDVDSSSNEAPTTSHLDTKCLIPFQLADLEAQKDFYLPLEYQADDDNNERVPTAFQTESVRADESLSNIKSHNDEDKNRVDSLNVALNNSNTSSYKRCRSESGYASYNDDIGGGKRASVDPASSPLFNSDVDDDATSSTSVPRPMPYGRDAVDDEALMNNKTTDGNSMFVCRTLVQGEFSPADDDITNTSENGTHAGMLNPVACGNNRIVLNDAVVFHFPEPQRVASLDNRVTYDDLFGGVEENNGSLTKDDDIDHLHLRRMVESRRRYDIELKLFIKEFHRRLIALPLPKTLLTYLSYGRA